MVSGEKGSTTPIVSDAKPPLGRCAPSTHPASENRYSPPLPRKPRHAFQGHNTGYFSQCARSQVFMRVSCTDCRPNLALENMLFSSGISPIGSINLRLKLLEVFQRQFRRLGVKNIAAHRAVNFVAVERAIHASPVRLFWWDGKQLLACRAFGCETKRSHVRVSRDNINDRC